MTKRLLNFPYISMIGRLNNWYRKFNKALVHYAATRQTPSITCCSALVQEFFLQAEPLDLYDHGNSRMYKSR